jgi:PRTRC genetic system protein E
MFRELMPLIEQRALSITVASLSDGRIRVNVVPQSLDKDRKINEKIGYAAKDKIAQVPESAIQALTTPLSLTGSAEEIDESLPQALLQFAEAHVRLQHTLDEARVQIAEAVKATEEREKSMGKSKTSTAASTEPKEDKKSGADELLPFWCVPSSKKDDAGANPAPEAPTTPAGVAPALSSEQH